MNTQSDFWAGHDHQPKRPEGLIIIEAMANIAYLVNFAIKQSMINAFQMPERHLIGGIIIHHQKDEEK